MQLFEPDRPSPEEGQETPLVSKLNLNINAQEPQDLQETTTKELYHISGWPEVADKKVGDEFTLNPGLGARKARAFISQSNSPDLKLLTAPAPIKAASRQR